MKGRLSWTLVGANRVVGCLDWHPETDEIAFGTHHFISIYDQTEERIVGILNGHKGHVNCVKWLDPETITVEGNILASASSDTTVRLWAWKEGSGHTISILTGFQSGVTALAASLYENTRSKEMRHLLAACSSDPEVNIWESTSDIHDWKRMPSLGTGSRINHSVALITNCASEGNHLLMALGGTDAVVRLCARTADSEEFRLVCCLRDADDWIRGIAFHRDSDSTILLASASQDRFVRVWSITRDLPTKTHPLAQLAPSMTFRVHQKRYRVKLDGLLIGHEDRVHSVQFHQYRDRLQLLSTSMDRTMILWEWDAEDRCWTQTESVGEAGSSSLGYYGGVFKPDGSCIVSHGFTGALHLWKKSDKGWIAKPALSGHVGSIVDMSLVTRHVQEQSEPVVVVVMTVSTDQSTRIAAVINGNLREIARPQVHGHDFHAVASISHKETNCFASCSAEKVIRVFSAPSSYMQYLSINHIVPGSVETAYPERTAYGAAIKALALTNTAVYDITPKEEMERAGVVESYTPGPDFAPHAKPSCVTGPPLEEHLSQNTLWPEIQKLYGHGDVVYSLATSPCGKILASASRAQREDTAVVFMWDTETWTPRQQLRGHTLTITRMEFSPSGRYLLSGSRDRTFCLFEKRAEGFELVIRKSKAHQRIIWDVSWTADDHHVATASRDQSVKIWTVPEAVCLLQISCTDSVTAIAFKPSSPSPHGSEILAAGFQNGDLCVWEIRGTGDELSYSQLWHSTESNRHSDAVHRIKWISQQSLDIHCREYMTLLASCSADHSLRLYRLE